MRCKKFEKVKKNDFPICFSIFIVAMVVLPLALFLHCNQKERPVQEEEQMGPEKFISYQQFIEDVKKAKYEDFSKRRDRKVLNEAEFLKMKQHILSMYKGVIVKNSFVMEKTGHVDCIDINTQPGLRRGGNHIQIQKPPPPIIVKESIEEQKAVPVQPMLSKEKKDRFGNLMFCEKGYIPMRRITLEELTRFRTLDDFFNKFGKAGRSGIPGVK